MIRVTDKHEARLRKLGPDRVLGAATRELEETAKVIAADAAYSIIDGGISGKGHIPSAPGSPPNADTHDLDRSIHVGETIELPGRTRTSVIADSDHALFMEKGTSAIVERPFMEPAAVRQHRLVFKGVAAAVSKAIR